jgi:hypothetical protein
MEPLQEKGLNRIYQSILHHDCGTITAFRGNFSITDNKRRNVSLLSRLHDKGLSVTSIKGGYIEGYGEDNQQKVTESSFFVVDFQNLGHLKNILCAFGKEFEQDSIMFIPKGGKEAILIGTSPYGAYPGLGKEEVFTNKVFGDRSSAVKGSKESPISGFYKDTPEFYSQKGNKVFYFESYTKDFSTPNGMHGRLGCRRFAEKAWQLLPDDALTILDI